MEKTRDSSGTDNSSGQLPSDGSEEIHSDRFGAWIGKYAGRGSSSASDSGAAVVEMAFIFSILVMLLVGVVTSAIAFGQKNSVENAAREASRYAATLPGDIDATWFQTVRTVARSAAQGDLDASVDGQYICVAHMGAGLRQEEVGGVPGPVESGDCYSDGLSDVRVQIVTRRDTEINAAFFAFDVTLEAPATARYERAQ